MSFKSSFINASGQLFASVLDAAGVRIPTVQFDFLSDGKKDLYNRDSAKLEAYYSNAYRACELAKARPLASLPIHVFKRKDGVRVTPTERAATDLERLLRTKWNPFVSSQEGFRWLVMTKDTIGEAFVRVEWSGSRIVALWPMSGVPEIETAYNGTAVYNYGGDKLTPPGRYLDREIVWVKSPILDADCIHGRSLAEIAADEVGMSIDLEKFYGSVLNGEGNFPGWLETDQKLTKEDILKLSDALQDSAGAVNAGHVHIFDKGLRYHSVNQTMVDMSLVEQEQWILQQVCRTLSVPPQEVFDLSNATYSNIEQGALNFANKTLVPECAEIERAFSNVLWSVNMPDLYVQFDLNGLLRGSYKERMEGYSTAIHSGFLNPNESRAKEDMPPYKGGDMYLRPSAYIPVDPETGEEMEGARRTVGNPPEPGASGEGGTPYSGDGDGNALNAIHADMVKRIQNRIAESGDTERTREFAVKVLKPYANACLIARREYDLESDMEEIFNARH